jgi:hypothetical protein
VSRCTVYIHKMFGDANEQGHLVATVILSDYKWATSNARDLFVRDQRPPSGRYLAYTAEQGTTRRHSSLLFEVKRADAIIITNGRTSIVGGDYTYSCYACGSDPVWIETDDRLLADGDGPTVLGSGHGETL